MKINFKKLALLAMMITVFTSCEKDDGGIDIPENYENGYFVTNEGNFGTGNGSVSFVSHLGGVTNDVFESVNNFALGDVVQSMNIINDNAYVLVNGSAKIEVVSVNSMHALASIDISSPRYMAQVNYEKAYVTDWGINGVQVIDLLANTISSTISCGLGPEGITVANGFAYVCNVGGWGLDNTVTVINTSTDAVETTLVVGDKPNSVVVDINGAVWVLTGGYTDWNADWTEILSESAGTLVKIVDNTIEATYTFAVGNHPEDLVINDSGTTLYYSDGSWSKAVYSMGIEDSELPNTPLINKSFYALGYNNEYIYGTDAVDFSQSGWTFRHTLDGSVVDSVQVGIGPGGYCFFKN